jgi:hypothetical protein
MKFHYKGNIKKLKTAVYRANLICEMKEFYADIASVRDFDLDNTTPTKISMELKYSPGLIFVKTYYRPFSRANAYFKPSQPEYIFINTAKLRRSINSIVNTIVHEGVHVVDHNVEDASFGHAGNTSHGKGETAPYKIGMLAQIRAEYYYPTPKILSRWQRFKNFLRRTI